MRGCRRCAAKAARRLRGKLLAIAVPSRSLRGAVLRRAGRARAHERDYDAGLPLARRAHEAVAAMRNRQWSDE